MIDESQTFLAVGCGDAILTKKVAALTGEAIGTDVTDRLVNEARPANFRFVASDGVGIPVKSGSVDFVLSNHLIEHLHPDDVVPHLEEILRALKPSGRYACATPNRLNGPHDISVFFGFEAAGFHLREYDHGTLAAEMRKVGFRDLRAMGLLKGRRYDVRLSTVSFVEQILKAIPTPIRRKVIHIGMLYRLSQVMVVGHK